MRSSEQIAPSRRPGSDGGESAPITIPRGTYIFTSVVALLLGGAAIIRSTSGLTPQESDLTSFFFPASTQILHGHPWAIYAVRAFGGYPNYNPPISIFLMAPLLALGNALKLNATPGGLITVVSIPFMAFVLLLGYVAIVALRRLYPAMPETQRFLAFILVVFSPLTWQTFTIWYHLEQPLMLALLVGAIVAFQARREGVAGVLAGLAVLTRTTAIVPLIAFGVMLLIERHWRPLLRFGGAAAVVVLVGLAPFFAFDRANTTYSLVSWRGGAEIGGNSIWSLVRYDGAQASSPLRYTLDHLARRLDMYTVILVVAIVAILAVRRLHVGSYGREAWAVLSIAALAVPMLSKNNWPYYYLEPFIFLLIWEFSSMHDRRSGVWRWPVLTLSYLSVAATLSQFIGLRSVGYGDRVAVGLVEFGTMFAFALAVWQRARAGRAEPSAAVGNAPVWGGAAQRPGRPQQPPVAQSAAERQWPAGGQPAPGPISVAGQPAIWPPTPVAGPVRPPEGWRPAGAKGSPQQQAERRPPSPPPPASQSSGNWAMPPLPAYPPAPEQPAPHSAPPDWLNSEKSGPGQQWPNGGR